MKCFLWRWILNPNIISKVTEVEPIHIRPLKVNVAAKLILLKTEFIKFLFLILSKLILYFNAPNQKLMSGFQEFFSLGPTLSSQTLLARPTVHSLLEDMNSLPTISFQQLPFFCKSWCFSITPLQFHSEYEIRELIWNRVPRCPSTQT